MDGEDVVFVVRRKKGREGGELGLDLLEVEMERVQQARRVRPGIIRS